ncbi:dihydrofolate reductase-like domain-containing protein [Cladochytrium replicatum]|nr:dihydrofolate reductase-like domain-containing protein [Cladochytrium replicatum]
MSLVLVVAANSSYGIGLAGRLPWRLSTDMLHFARVTTHLNCNSKPYALITPPSAPPCPKNAVVMGRTTWQSIPIRFRPLPDRTNIVLSRNSAFAANLALENPDVLVAPSLDAVLSSLASHSPQPSFVFVIGGAQLYSEALSHPSASHILLTHITSETKPCDTFIPNLDSDPSVTSLWRPATNDELHDFLGDHVPVDTQTERGLDFRFRLFVRKEQL